MFGTKHLSEEQAYKVADAINTWAGPKFRREIITPERARKLTPIATADEPGYCVYAYQWGDVSILVNVWRDGRVMCKHISW